MAQIREKDILYQAGNHWVIATANGYEVYKDGVTHAVRVSQSGWKGEKGLTRAIAEADRRHQHAT